MDSETDSSQPVDQLIVVGSSAGGVEALSVLVGSLPAGLPASFVVAQHLDPSRPSHLGEILGRRSIMPVITVSDCENLLPGNIYIVPSNRHVEITDHEVRVHADATRRPTPSIDLLLATAAKMFGERLVALILTGSGSDGAAGAHAVKEAGGTVIIQDPATAAFPSMPRALASPLVDATIPLDDIGAFLVSFLTQPAETESETADDQLSTLLERLRDRRGIDFAAYKSPTIVRRLRRRMAVVGVNALGDYLTHLDQHPEEEERLVGSFLIKVTRFFRDPALFARLRDKILPELVDAAQASGRELRFWSAGCATGEEAYSLALLLSDLLADRSNPPPVRIFATDLDDKALVFARRGIYSASALADVPPEMVERYFEAHEGSHQVRKAVRSLIVFGTHDLAQRAPFPQTDLVLCRNVLIYFTPKLQKRALEIFAYSLRDGGYLVLGSSEIPRPAERAFTDVDRRLRLYRRTGPRPAFPPMHLPVPADAAPGKPGSGSARNPSTLALALRQAEGETQVAQAAGGRAEDLVRRLPIGIAVVDRQYDIEMINGVARELLGIHGLAIGQDLIHLAQRVPSTALREAIDAIVRDGPPQKLLDVVTAETATGESRHIGISCYPDRHDPGGAVETVMVMVEDVTALTSARGDGAAAAQRVERLAQSNYQLLAANRELTDALDKLRELSDELRLSTAAAEVSAEEIETLNEELQSTNEELETLHEEAQATVEELSVANGELEARAVELEEVTDFQAGERARLEAVLTSMADAVVVVDHRGRAVRTNAAYDDLLGVLGASFVPLNECGTPLPSAAAPQARAARGETFRLDFTAIAEDGTQHWFEAIGRPLSDENAGVGVVVIHDITDRSVRRLQEEFLAWAGHELRTPLTALQGFLQMAGRRVSAGPDGNTRLRASLDRAVEQSRRLASLIEELVDVTRLESGQFSFKTSALDLAELAAHAVEIAQVLAEEKAITLKVDGGPLVVAGDAGRLEQVVLNLLTNAIAYAPGADRIEVIARRDGEDSTLAVRDFGPGIDPARFSSLFDRFTRGQSDERPVSGGLGLGLFISREIVRAHGGEITVESEHDTGTTFTIRIPLSPNADA